MGEVSSFDNCTCQEIKKNKRVCMFIMGLTI